MHHTLKSIVDELVELGVVKKSDSAICYFGLYEGSIFVFNVILTLIIASAMQNLWTGILFFISFFPVRRYAGGFHAKTRKECFLFSVFIIVGAMKGIEVISRFSFNCQIVMLVLSALFIFLLAPVQNGRKVLSVTEIKAYKKKLIVILSIECTIGILLGIHDVGLCVETIGTSMIVCLGLGCLGTLSKDK